MAAPLYYQGAGAQAHNQWQPAKAKAAFNNLVVRPVPPVQVLLENATATQFAPGTVYSQP